MIYFAKRSSDGSVKIGTTKRLGFRILDLERDAECEISVLGITDGSFAEEKELHRQFDHLRRDGEWFSPDKELLDHISEFSESWDRDEHAPQIIALRCRPEYKKHLGMISGKEERPPAQIIEFALRLYAATHGYDPFPKR